MAARALAPVELAIANWKGFVAARQSWRRLRELLAAIPAEDGRMALPSPARSLTPSAAAQPAEQQQQPDLPKLARADKAKIVTAQKKRAEHRPPQKAQPKPQEQAKETRNAAASSAAAPQAQTISHQTAAPINSDANSNAQAKLSWESLVKGKLNRIKDYPLDARSRRRSGSSASDAGSTTEGND